MSQMDGSTVANKLHEKMMSVARDEVKNHIVDQDGEKCFNLFTYLDILENRLDTIFSGSESPTGSFLMSMSELARYLWCCLATDDGSDVYPTKFRGMPVLD